MSDNALQATLTMQLGQTLAALKNVQTELGAVKKAVREVKAEKNSMQGQASAGYQKLAKRAKETADASKGMGESLRNAGMALSRFGGPLQFVGEKLGGGMGMAGAFGRVAAGAALAGIAFRAFMAVADASSESVRKATEVANRYRDAIKAGKQEEASQALAGLSQEDTVRKLLFRGGDKAVQKAQGLVEAHGVSFEEAADVVNTTANLPEQTQAKVILAALQARDTGEVSAAEAAKKIAGNQFLLDRLEPSEEEMRRVNGARDAEDFKYERGRRRTEVAARVVAMATARDDDEFAKTYGDGFAAVPIERTEGMARDPYLRAARRAKGTLGRQSAIERARATQDAEWVAREKVDSTLNPVATQIRATDEAGRRAIADLQASADAEGHQARTIRDAMLPITGGSEEQKLRKAQIAQGQGALQGIDPAVLNAPRLSLPKTIQVEVVGDRTRNPVPGGTE